jgi:lactate permease
MDTMWKQVVDPLNNLALSALAAAIPIGIIFWALIIRKMKGYYASLLTVSAAFLLAVLVYGMPAKLAVLSVVHGAMYGLFPICWIIVGAVFLFNVTVKSGQFDVIRAFMASVTPDRRLQALLIAFSFGAFIEGAAGMGSPLVITSAMLAGLGFRPLYAAGICLIANTAPVAFGAVGTPILVAAQVSDVPVMAISQLVGRTLPVLSLVVPFYLVWLIAGFSRSVEVLPAILVSGVSFAFFQWLASNYLGYALPDVIAGMASMAALMILLKKWQPRTVWRFPEEEGGSGASVCVHSGPAVLRACSPFIIMTVLVIVWGLEPVKAALNAAGRVRFAIPGLSGAIQKPDGSVLPISLFDLNFLSNSGTALMLAGLLSLPLTGMGLRKGLTVFAASLRQLMFPILTIALVVGFAFITNYSGMSVTMAMALAGTGVLFPFFSPMLGWLGVFLTGSDTSSNALFSKLQATSAQAIGVDPLVTVAGNASGGVAGKMISPQSIALGAAAVGMVGKESQLFRFTVKHSFIMLSVICVITVLQAYVVKRIVPSYGQHPAAAVSAATPKKILYEHKR